MFHAKPLTAEEQPEAFEDRVARVLAEQGIDPRNWTDEEIGGEEGAEGWRNISDIWEIRQAGRVEWTRRRRERGDFQEQYADTYWTR